MAKTNVKATVNNTNTLTTHEGGIAKRITPELQLRRSVMAHMLFEDKFYEDGQLAAVRVAELIPKVDPQVVANIAIEAREAMKLRHVPLYIVREMARLESHKGLVSSTLSRVIQRADELTEFLAIYWRHGNGVKKSPISNQVRKGLAAAFPKFNEYALAKYNRNSMVKLLDVLRLVRPIPVDDNMSALWKRLIKDELKTPDTWEVALSACGSNIQRKKAVWERLLSENKLGALALLRNLRNMASVGVDEGAIRTALLNIKTERVLPFRFLSAAKHAPQWEPELEKAMLSCLSSQEKLPGKTVLVVDASGSMSCSLSSKSELSCFDGAAALAILLREICEEVKVYTFEYDAKLIPARHGFALRDAMGSPCGGTALANSIKTINKKEGSYDRMIVITDEQTHDGIAKPLSEKSYLINVACYQNGVGYGKNWLHLDGFSEAVIDYLREYEKL